MRVGGKKFMIIFRKVCLGIGAFCAAGIASVSAQNYPTKPVRIVVPFAPGGSSEIVARAVAQKLTEQLGQQFIVENKPGAAGNIATGEVAKSDPDGYTLILGHVGTFAVNPILFGAKLPYDANKDFAPIGLLAKVPSVFVVSAKVPANNLKEFVALAKSKPGNMNYGSAGNASSGHLSFEYLKLIVGMDVQHIPYKGTGPQLQDLLGGRTDAASAGAPPLMAHIKSGALKAIAVGTASRVPSLPNVGTVAEQGYPGFETSQWYGLLAPVKTPPAILAKLSDEVGKALRAADVRAKFEADGTSGGSGVAADFAAFIKAEQKRWEDVVTRANISLD
jgi:tripartite-type tricarboxylate transporter receptor subunit TctC